VKRKARAARARPRPRAHRLQAIGPGLALLLLYWLTLCPTIYSGDAAELATAGATFGIPHPPGYPLLTLLSNLWTRLLPLGDVAWRINLLSAISAAGAAALLAGLLRRVQAGAMAASAAGLGLGLGLSFWSQALISEVYAFDMLLATVTLVLAHRAGQRQSLGACAMALLSFGLWVGHRNVNLLFLPAVLLLAWPGLWPQLRHLRAWPALAAALLAPLLVLLYLPLASAADPKLDTGDPETWSRLVEMVKADVYRQYLFAGDWWQNLKLILSGLPRELGLGLLLAPLGAALAWRQQRRLVLALGYVWLTNLLFSASYGVPDVTVFTLPGVLALWALAGLGLGRLRERLPWPALAALGLAAFLPLALVNFGENNLRGQTLARDFARDALSFPGAKGIVLSHVDSVSFSLWYAQYVEGRRPDLLVVSRGRAVDWHQEQARRLRPELDIPLYSGPDSISRWPALLTLRNGGKVPVYVTANLRGYFAPRDAAELNLSFIELPAGLMTRLAPADSPPPLDHTLRRNVAFWHKAWPHAAAARRQRLGVDMTALLLHYASMRVLFARYCLLQGHPGPALEAARAVIRLDTGPLIERVNRDFLRMKSRYHMSEMPRMAATLALLAEALQQGKATREQVRQQLEPAIPLSSRESPPGESPEVERANAQGIELARQGQYGKALDRFERVLQLSPNHLGALFNRAKVLAMLERDAEAVEAYQALLQHAPAHQPGLVGLAELKIRKHPRQALQLYLRAQQAPGPPQLRGVIRQRIRQLERRLAPRPPAPRPDAR
jgi:tetratricopeptide (TPR) repeat protein